MSERTVASLLTPPDQWQWGEIFNTDNQKIRYGWNTPANARGLIIIAEGRTEVIEEYFETIRDFNDKGFACAIMDWQGQGLSYRYYGDNSRQHSEGFDRDMADFALFLSILRTHSDIAALPRILFAHSMGANITLRYMAEYADHPFVCATLSAPMLGLNPKRIIKYTASPILRLAKTLKWLKRYAFGQVRWNETFANITKYKVSSDPIRREVQAHLFKTKPDLQCGGVTFGWLDAALSSIAKLHRADYCKRITLPVFMAAAGKDIVVDNDGSCKTASLLPDCKFKCFPKAEHQIHRERDDIRDAFFDDFHTFTDKYL